MTPTRYTLSDLRRGLTNPRLFLSEVRRLCTKPFNNILYKSAYGDWLGGEELKDMYGVYSCSDETEFSIEYEKESGVPEYFGKFTGTYSPPPRYIYVINDGSVQGPQAIPLTSEGQPIHTRTADGDRFLSQKKEELTGDIFSFLSAHLFPLKNAGELLGSDPVFPLMGIWDTNYYHWITEYLPKLRGLEYYEERTGEKPTVLLTPEPSGWQLEWLELLEIDEQRRVSWMNGTAEAEKLILTDHRMQTGGAYSVYDPSLDDICWVRDRALSAVPRRAESPSKIYISRQGIRRRVSNFDEAKGVLRRHGFDIYRLEELSVPDQVSLLSTATHVAGPHGSGLVNIIFSPEDGTVLELLPEGHNNPHYFRLAQMLGQDYHCVVSDDASQGAFHVDPGKLSEKLSQL